MQPSLPRAPALCAGLAPLTPLKEMRLRRRLVREAHSWERTPYREQADIKGAGIDCAMLLVRCWVDAGIVEPFDPRPYAPRWHQHHGEERYQAWLAALCDEVETPEPGDMVLFQFGKVLSHGGIIVAPGRMVNASAFHHECTQNDLDEGWLAVDPKGGKDRPRRRVFYSMFARLRREHP